MNLNINRKYFNKIILLITTALFVMVLVFSSIVYYNIENSVLKNEYNSNTSLLYQIKHNIDYVNEMARNLCTYIFSSNDSKMLMYNNGDEEYYNYYMEAMRRIAELRNAVPFIHSIAVYNNNVNIYYSTDNGVYSNNELEDSILKSYKSIPVLKPVYRNVQNLSVTGSKAKEYVFSYFLYDSKDKKGYMNGGIILNIKSKWLFDNINLINTTNAKLHDRTFILDEKGDFIEDKETNDPIKSYLKNAYYNYISKSALQSEKADFFTTRINNENYMITFIKLENADWVILRVQLYDEVFKYIKQLKTGLIVITVVFLSFALMIALAISRRIYKPIGNLVNEVGSLQFEKAEFLNSKDEISYLNLVYKYSNEQLNILKEDKRSNREVIKTYYLKKILLDASSFSYEEFVKVKEENDIAITMNDQVVVCILRLDNFKALESSCSSKDIEIYKFAVMNITSEILKNNFSNEAIDMKNEQIAVILDLEGSRDDFFECVTGLIKQAQDFIYKNYSISVSACFSEIAEDRSKLTECYNMALSYSMFRFVFGKRSIIIPRLVKDNMANKSFDYPYTLEKKLIEDIRSGNMDKVEANLSTLLNNVAKFNYNNIMLSVMYLVNSIKNTIDDINQKKIDTVYLDYNLLLQQVYELETLDELHVKLMDILKKILDEGKNSVGAKYIIITEAVKSIIDRNYQDSGLCLQQIASIMNMSSQYIGRIFRENTGVSISEFINEERMSRVLNMLKDTKLSINQIIEKVGIDNETYFYRLFKKRFGTTPREYILKEKIAERQ